MVDVVQEIVDAFEQRGREKYGAEAVTQLQHALQSAQLALNANESDSLIVAALLHDLGHLLSNDHLPDGCEDNLDDAHESIGHAYLHDHFGPAIADPVRLHVVAKRYLCTVKPAYEQKLSPTSLKSYHDQGGRMSDEEKQAFEEEPHFRAALKLRHWDDTAKDPNAETKPLQHFVPLMRRTLVS